MTDSNKDHSTPDPLRFTDEQFIWRFSPNQTDPKLLEAIFVGRESLLQNVIEKIAESATSNATHHVLLYGPRGIGKSHFTSLLHSRLLKDETLNESVRVAWLNEDETTTSMVQLLVRIYRALCKGYPEEYSTLWLDELLDQSPQEIADILSRRLVARFEKRKLVVLVENLNLLFESLGTDGQHELRTLLQEQSFACLIATTQQLFKAVTDRNEPFFGFFHQIPLKPLSFSDAQQLLLKIARTKGQVDLADFLNTPDGRGRVRAIHDLAGGNHRVYIVLSGFVTRESLDQLVVPFQKMADELTPYYQERLRWISPLQRQIVELLCRRHGTVNPKEMARQLLVDQRSIGKQVRILEEIGYLASTKRGRETFYELSEPLMRLAYEVKEQSLLGMLIDFLRIWYRPHEMQILCTAGLSPTTQAYLEAAWERLQTTRDPRVKLLHDELKQAEAEGRSNDLASLWEELAAASDSESDWFHAGCLFHDQKDYTTALSCYDEALQLDPKFSYLWNNKANALHCLGRYREALACYDEAIRHDAQSAFPRFNRSESLFALNRWDEGFDAISDAFRQLRQFANFGDAASMFGLIFLQNEDESLLQTRLSRLVEIYQNAAERFGFRKPHRENKLATVSIDRVEEESDEVNEPNELHRFNRSNVNPLAHLADGLVKSLSKINQTQVTPSILMGYVVAIENSVAGLDEFEIALRLFRYGIRYLISGKESEFVELIQPERRILRQALGLSEEN